MIEVILFIVTMKNEPLEITQKYSELFECARAGVSLRVADPSLRGFTCIENIPEGRCLEILADEDTYSICKAITDKMYTI